jgi:hypothetical protein
MIEVLKWMHESIWHYLTVCNLLFWTYFWLAVIATRLEKIGRPRKRVKHTYEDTHKL